MHRHRSLLPSAPPEPVFTCSTYPGEPRAKVGSLERNTVEQLTLFVITGGVAAILGVLIYGFSKIRTFQRYMYSSLDERIPRLLTRELNTQLQTHFHQVEALAGLFLELGFTHSLAPTRGWAASPDFLREIALHALQSRPKMIAECGSGVSTVVLARCLQMNRAGHVYSLEHLAEHAEKTRQELERQGLTDWATVSMAPLRAYEFHGEIYSWYSTEGLPSVEWDMLVIDGPPIGTSQLARYPAGPLLFGHLNPMAAVFLDDADRQDERTILQRWAGEFHEFIQENRDCEKGCVILWKRAVKAPRSG